MKNMIVMDKLGLVKFILKYFFNNFFVCNRKLILNKKVDVL